MPKPTYSAMRARLAVRRNIGVIAEKERSEVCPNLRRGSREERLAIQPVEIE